MNFATHITEAFRQDGIIMWVIFFAQMASFAIIAERITALYFNRRTDNQDIAKSFEQELKKGQFEAVLMRAQGMARSNPLARAIQAGTQAAMNSGGREEIQAKMDEVLLRENSLIEKRTGFLAAIGNVGTLMGLLGTIVGLINSFAAVANTNPAEKATLLSNGIAMAMHATAYGLIMAIPALVMFAVLQNRAISLQEDLNHSALSVFNWLSFGHEAAPARRTVRK
jgi:biopolymer transport protein ExbB